MSQKAKRVTGGIEINRSAEYAEIVRRAIAAYDQSGEDIKPSKFDVREHGGKKYVILENSDGPLAVYRIEDEGRLKSLNRWPKAIEKV